MDRHGTDGYGAIAALQRRRLMTEQDRRIGEAIARHGRRLRDFIRRRVADPDDAEDIAQEVLYELVRAYRLVNPIEQVSAWLFRVARNRMTDLFRSRQREEWPGTSEEQAQWEDLLPSPEAGPEAAYAREVLMDAVEEALEELPQEQREVFLAHEIDGRSFKEIAERTGVPLNTLLSRKHYAVLHLRRRLRQVHDDYAGRKE